MDLRVQRHARLEREIAGDELTQDRLHAAGLDLGQEADLAQVDSQQRHIYFRDGPGRPQECAVTAEHDERARVCEFADDGLSIPGRRRPVGDPAHLAPAFGALAQVQRRLLCGVVRKTDPFELHAPASSPNLRTHSSGRSIVRPSTGT
jgi:hypothetical protein